LIDAIYPIAPSFALMRSSRQTLAARQSSATAYRPMAIHLRIDRKVGERFCRSASRIRRFF
jgi:hypothetical protein